MVFRAAGFLFHRQIISLQQSNAQGDPIPRQRRLGRIWMAEASRELRTLPKGNQTTVFGQQISIPPGTRPTKSPIVVDRMGRPRFAVDTANGYKAMIPLSILHELISQDQRLMAGRSYMAHVLRSLRA